jgi:hypothetical protein
MSKEDTVDELVEQLETKLELLREWQIAIGEAKTLAAAGKFDESDAIDNRAIEIEEHFEEEYGIKFDSYGDMY